VRRHLEILRDALRRVFADLRYVALALLVTGAAFLMAVWLPNLGLLAEVFGASGIPLDAKLGVAFSLLGGIATNFSPLAAAYTVAIAGLFGTITAMTVYLLRRTRRAAGRNVAVGFGGVASGVLGVGCAACGSLVLGAVLPFASATAALAVLPLEGAEFGILSVALLSASLLFVSRNIASPAACPLAPPAGERRSAVKDLNGT